MTTLKKLLLPFTAVLVLAWAGFVLAQNTPGGVFDPGRDQTVSGQWTWRTLASPFVFEGTTDNAFETTVTVTNPTADRTVTIQDATGTVVIANATTAAGIRAGTLTLDGSNPSSATTGLSAIAGCSVTDVRSTAPTIVQGPAHFTMIYTAAAGRLDVYAWNFTSASDPTLVASVAANALINYVCIGTP